MGAGVAGLQAIATARRLGARRLGHRRAAGREGAGREPRRQLRRGRSTRRRSRPRRPAATPRRWPRTTSASRRRSSPRRIKKQDIVICTALIPGRPAPRAGHRRHGAGDEAGLGDRRPRGRGRRQLRAVGAGRGRRDGTASRSSARSTCPARIAVDASALYARNLLNFLGLSSTRTARCKIDPEDEIVKGAAADPRRRVVHPAFAATAASGAAAWTRPTSVR